MALMLAAPTIYVARFLLALTRAQLATPVRIQSSTPEEGVMLFPLYGALSRRISGGLSDAPYYRLNPFELPYVPWVGTYQLSYRLDDGIAYLPPESERQIRIGTVFPRSLPKIVKQEPNKGGAPNTPVGHHPCAGVLTKSSAQRGLYVRF